MARQINFNVQGSPSRLATWVADTGQSFPLQIDTPGRMIVQADDPRLHTAEGSSIVWAGQQIARLLIPPDGFVGEAVDDPKFNCQLTPPVLTFAAPAPVSQLPTIIGDHFELHGNRWVWRMADGFCDHALLFTGNVQQVRDCYKQAQDLDVRGRRVFGMLANITHFDPRTDYPKFWATLDQLVEISHEFGQPLDYNVFPDSQLLGMDLGWCQAHWAQLNDHVRGKAFVSLTNEFDHGGNLVGRPADYANPGGLSSQGSAVQDATPPCPALGTGTGYAYWEWHAADDPTHFSHEYYIWQGRSTGAIKPCVITEHGRRIQEGSVDLDYVRSLTHASMANGCGLTVHTEDGKYSRVLGPNQAGAVKLSMSLLANGQA